MRLHANYRKSFACASSAHGLCGRMLPDPPDGFSEKPFPDPGRDPDPAAAQAETDFPGRSMERYSRKIYEFLWIGPTGPLTVTVTDYADYFGTRHGSKLRSRPTPCSRSMTFPFRWVPASSHAQAMPGRLFNDSSPWPSAPTTGRTRPRARGKAICSARAPRSTRPAGRGGIAICSAVLRQGGDHERASRRHRRPHQLQDL